MGDDEQHRAAESVPVTLARMEGKFDNLVEKVGGLSATVSDMRHVVDKHTLDIQQLRSDAISKDLTVIATAKALSEAKNAADATAQAEIAKAERAWSPVSRFYAFVVAASALGTFIYFVVHRP